GGGVAAQLRPGRADPGPGAAAADGHRTGRDPFLIRTERRTAVPWCRSPGAGRVASLRLMKEWIERLEQRPGVEHLLRAGERYTSRLGDRFCAAITYSSVLALVPILVFAFSITGFVLTVSRPDLLQ